VALPSALRITLGAALGSVALWATLRDLSPQVLATALAAIHPLPALAALVTNLAAVVVLACRWQRLFRPDYAHVRLWPLFRATMIGQMLNIASPVRVGEIARLYGIAASEGIPVGRVLATLAVEKAFELSVFGAAAITLLALFAVPPEISATPASWLAIPVIAMMSLWLIASKGPRLARRLARLRPVPERLRGRLIAFSDGFAAGVGHALSMRAGPLLLVLSVAAMVLAAGANQVLLSAFGLQLPMWSGLALLIVLQVGSVPPSLPGRLGIFNYLTVLTLQWLGIDRVTAASYSIALYVIACVPKLVLGTLFLMLVPVRPTEDVPEGVS
jgi:uncharacterized protein (TIRG00374 family)